MKYVVGTLLFFIATLCHAESIGFGVVVAVKQYDLGADKNVKIYLNSNATHVNSNCLENGKVYGIITPSQHDEAATSRMFSLAIAAYMSGKKIRIHSETNSCQIDFVAIQEAVF